jgi:hypothetical protein
MHIELNAWEQHSKHKPKPESQPRLKKCPLCGKGGGGRQPSLWRLAFDNLFQICVANVYLYMHLILDGNPKKLDAWI